MHSLIRRVRPLAAQCPLASSFVVVHKLDDGHRSMMMSTSSSPSSSPPHSKHSKHSNARRKKKKKSTFVGHNFPDFIEHWSRDAFFKVGSVLGTSTGVLGFLAWQDVATYGIPTATMTLGTAMYYKIGQDDIQQTSHAIRRNYPVLGNLRYVLETIRPEIRQYLVESDLDGKPYDRMRRSIIYQRAKNVDDTMAFGTRKDVYATNYEWACHSMWPKIIDAETDAVRCTIGTASFGTTQPHSASILNISAMSYGAISDNAILALSRGAQLGGFYHNTGEGGVSKSHKEGGGDLVWNMGTGYFGCGVTDPKTGIRIFDADTFQETLSEAKGQVKMIEIKLSQGAKPGHGGILPKAKITPDIADARKLEYPATMDCHSPPGHSAFDSPEGLIEFIMKVRELSGGLPVGIKLCVGDPSEVAALVKAMVKLQNGPDFISIDGGEGGTGAAPPEYSDNVGLPLEEGLAVVRNFLVGANMKEKVKLNCSGRVTNGFSMVRMIALGADITCAARAFMMSLGCIQALKCNTNKCPTGIATQDPKLQYGLDPYNKTNRVYHFHQKTVHAAAEIVGTIGRESFQELTSGDIMRRVRQGKVQTMSEYLPEVPTGCLLNGSAPRRLQAVWDSVVVPEDESSLSSSSSSPSTTNTVMVDANKGGMKRWIY